DDRVAGPAGCALPDWLGCSRALGSSRASGTYSWLMKACRLIKAQDAPIPEVKHAIAKTLGDSAAAAAWLMSYFRARIEGDTEEDPYDRLVERWPVPLGIVKIEKILYVA